MDEIMLVPEPGPIRGEGRVTDPTVALYTDPKAARFIHWAGVAGVTITLISIAVAIYLVWLSPKRESTQAVLYGLAGVWGVGGPMWFFSEYFFFYRKSGAAGSWEQFKHGQQVSAAIWAGLSVSLAALGSSDIVKPASAYLTCELQVAAQIPANAGNRLAVTNCKPGK